MFRTATTANDEEKQSAHSSVFVRRRIQEREHSLGQAFRKNCRPGTRSLLSPQLLAKGCVNTAQNHRVNKMSSDHLVRKAYNQRVV